jgi:hypothetical protein
MADSSRRYVCRAETVRAPVVALNGCFLVFTCHSFEIFDRLWHIAASEPFWYALVRVLSRHFIYPNRF